MINKISTLINRFSFDNWSQTYEDDVVPSFKRRGYSYESLGQDIFSYIQASSAKKVCELGVGTGLVGQAIRKCGYNDFLVGTDISQMMLKKASQKNVYDLLIRLPCENMSTMESEHDMIYTCFMYHSIQNKTIALSNIHRALKPGAMFVLVGLFRTGARKRYISYLKDNIHSMLHEKMALSNYQNRQETIDDLKKNGFTIVSHKLLDKDSIIAVNSAGKMEHGMIICERNK
ncbi:methyltransferase domain-containing protein [Vibrio mimicus]